MRLLSLLAVPRAPFHGDHVLVQIDGLEAENSRLSATSSCSSAARAVASEDTVVGVETASTSDRDRGGAVVAPRPRRRRCSRWSSTTAMFVCREGVVQAGDLRPTMVRGWPMERVLARLCDRRVDVGPAADGPRAAPCPRPARTSRPRGARARRRRGGAAPRRRRGRRRRRGAAGATPRWPARPDSPVAAGSPRGRPPGAGSRPSTRSSVLPRRPSAPGTPTTRATGSIEPRARTDVGSRRTTRRGPRPSVEAPQVAAATGATEAAATGGPARKWIEAQAANGASPPTPGRDPRRRRPIWTPSTSPGEGRPRADGRRPAPRLARGPPGRARARAGRRSRPSSRTSSMAGRRRLRT